MCRAVESARVPFARFDEQKRDPTGPSCSSHVHVPPVLPAPGHAPRPISAAHASLSDRRSRAQIAPRKVDNLLRSIVSAITVPRLPRKVAHTLPQLAASEAALVVCAITDSR